MQAIEALEKVLNYLRNISGVEASVVVSRDGLLVCSAAKGHADTFGALSAVMFGAAGAASVEFGNGAPSRLIVESKNGKIIATGAGPNMLLVIVTGPDANLGLVLLEAAKARDMIREIL